MCNGTEIDTHNTVGLKSSTETIGRQALLARQKQLRLFCFERLRRKRYDVYSVLVLELYGSSTAIVSLHYTHFCMLQYSCSGVGGNGM